MTNQKNLFSNTKTFITGISDFHSLVVSSLKQTFSKGKPRMKFYRDYKNFNNDLFQKDLKENLAQEKDLDYKKFEKIFTTILDKHAKLKKKFLRYNNNAFMTKSLRKAIMTRSRLKNRFIKHRTTENWNSYKKQRNFCVSLLRKTKKQYFSELDHSDIRDNKKFWKTIKPFFSDKGLSSNNIILVEKSHLVSDETNVASVLNNYFVNISSTIKTINFANDSHNLELDQILELHETHPSVQMISNNKSLLNESIDFNFHEVSQEAVRKVIEELNVKKSVLSNSISATFLKSHIDIYLPSITNIINNSFKNKVFPDELKYAEVTPIYKKGSNFDKENYRPISILSNFSKVFEKIMFQQITQYIDSTLSPLLSGFRKNNSTQYSLLNMLEKWKNELDKGFKVGTIFMDLSKAFDTINHNLLIAKLNAYSFSKPALSYILSYLRNRSQRTKINNTFSSWKHTNSGVPQGSVLGPLFFNIFINDIFNFVNHSHLSNYADDNTLYCFDKDINIIKEKLHSDFESLEKWFFHNCMVLNPGKCHFMALGHNVGATESFSYKGKVLVNSSEETILGITIDNKLSFKTHIKNLCRKVSNKLNALSRINHLISKQQKVLLFKSFVQSQLRYCPLIWMFSTRTCNSKINRLQERSLRLISDDKESTFEELLKSYGQNDCHTKNLQTLMTEVYKFNNGLSPPIMDSVFHKRNINYDLRNHREFHLSHKNTSKYGTETVSYKAPQIWQTLTEEIKLSESLEIFKNKIKKWDGKDCPCNLCKRYYTNLGYI